MLDEAQGRYEANTTLQLIANDLGVSRQRLAVRLRERGVAIRGEGPSREQVLEMVRRYSQGESLAKVGTRLGFSGGTVRAYLIRAGVPIRDAQGRSRYGMGTGNYTLVSRAHANLGPCAFHRSYLTLFRAAIRFQLRPHMQEPPSPRS